MTHGFGKRLVSVFFAVVLIVSVILARPLAALASEADISEGTYEGEYDTNGKRSGFGTWAYYNFLYVGNWENDMPNGEGTLYTNESQNSNGAWLTSTTIVHGNWVDGCAQGTVEVACFDEDKPYVFCVDVVDGAIRRVNGRIQALNARRSLDDFLNGEVGYVAPWAYGLVWVEKTAATPWNLYERYPTGKVEYTPVEKIQNSGLGVSSGNRGNSIGGAPGMALLGDWIFIRNGKYTKQGDYIFVVYKMRGDGSQITQLYEGGYGKEGDYSGLGLPLQVVGDWLYMGWPCKMQADDVEFTYVEGDEYIEGLVLDDWEYGTGYTPDESTPVIRKTKLDGSQRIEASYKLDRRIVDRQTESHIMFVDEDWIYYYDTNEFAASSEESQVSQLTKIKNDGSGEVEIHLFREGVGTRGGVSDNKSPQIAGGRMYYMETYYVTHSRVESSLHSVDLNFEEDPITLIPRSEEQRITGFNVTEDSIYYGMVTISNGQGAMMRAGLDGGNPTVLAPGWTPDTIQRYPDFTGSAVWDRFSSPATG